MKITIELTEPAEETITAFRRLGININNFCNYILSNDDIQENLRNYLNLMAKVDAELQNLK